MNKYSNYTEMTDRPEMEEDFDIENPQEFLPQNMPFGRDDGEMTALSSPISNIMPKSKEEAELDMEEAKQKAVSAKGTIERTRPVEYTSDDITPARDKPITGEARGLTQPEKFGEAVTGRSLKEATREGMLGDANRILQDWIFGKTDEDVAREHKTRIDDKTPQQAEISFLLDQYDRLVNEGKIDPDSENAIAMQGELYNRYHAASEASPDKTPEVTYYEMAEYAAENWGEVSGELVKLLVGDAALLATPIGRQKGITIANQMTKTLKAGAKMTKAAEIAGGVTGMAVTAGITGMGIEALDQLANEGKTDLGEILETGQQWTVGGAAFGVVMDSFKIGRLAKNMTIDSARLVGNIAKSAKAKSVAQEMNIQPGELKEIVNLIEQSKGKVSKFKFDPDETIEQAANRVIKDIGLNEAKHAPVIKAALLREAQAAKVGRVADDTFDPAAQAEAIGAGSRVGKTYDNNKDFVRDAIQQNAFVKGKPLETVIRDTLGENISKSDATKMASELRQDKGLAKQLDTFDRQETLKVIAAGAPPEMTQIVQGELARLLAETGGRIKPHRTAMTEFGDRPSTMAEAFKAAVKTDGRKITDAEINKIIDDIEDLPYMLREQAGITDKQARMMGKAVDEPAMFQRQAGKADPRLLGLIALAGGASLLGDTAMEKMGAAGVALGGFFAGKGALNVIRGGAQQIKKQSQQTIKNIMDINEGQIAKSNLASWRSMMAIQKKVPDIGRRQMMSLAIEGTKTVTPKMAKTPGFKLKAGTEVKLTADEKKVVKEIQDSFEQLYKVGESAGIFKDGSAIQNYISHFWANGMKSDEEVFSLFQSVGKHSVSPKTIHANRRKLPTYTVGVEAGFTPKTMDASEVLKLYSNAVSKAIANKQMLTNLKNSKVGDSQLIAKSADAPDGYLSIAHPQLGGVKVHPEIAPSLKFFFDSTEPNAVMRGALAVNFASKRMLVSTSLFHANALLESMLFTGVANPLRPLQSRKNYVSTLDMLRKGEAGDIIDIGLKNGLTIGTIEDIGTDAFYHGMREAQRIADRHGVIGKTIGKGLSGFEKANEKVDHVMWDRIATGGKLMTFAAKYEAALLNPKFANMSKGEIAKVVAEFTNDAFGGQNWRRVAETFDSKFGRQVAMAMFAPDGRRAMQLLMFAPDWTISNARVLYKALPFASKNALEAQLHRAYAVRSAIYFTMVGTAINSIFAGRFKPLWENEDPTKIDMEDGRKMSIFKQTAEVLHWVTDPTKTASGKLGLLPKQMHDQLLNKKYMAESSPPLFKKDAGFLEKTGARMHKLGSMGIPIGLQGAYGKLADEDEDVSSEDFWRFASGMIGHPITGKKED